jgi:hypothetical protein
LDTLGKLTIGYGFNIDRDRAETKKILESYGYNFELIIQL